MLPDDSFSLRLWIFDLCLDDAEGLKMELPLLMLSSGDAQLEGQDESFMAFKGYARQSHPSPLFAPCTLTAVHDHRTVP